MTELFAPKGDVAEWRMVYDHVATLDINDVVTYEDLSTVLGRPFLVDRGPIYEAVRVLEREDRRTMANVRGVGYRVVEAVEHETLARAHVRKSRRSMTRAHSKIRSADRNALPPEIAQRFDAIEVNLGRQEAAMFALTRKMAKQERAIQEATQIATTARQEVAGAVEELQDLRAKVEEALARFERDRASQ